MSFQNINLEMKFGLSAKDHVVNFSKTTEKKRKNLAFHRRCFFCKKNEWHQIVIP